MKKLVSLLFHRVVLVAVFILIQIAVLLVMILRFNSYFVYFYWLCVAVSHPGCAVDSGEPERPGL